MNLNSSAFQNGTAAQPATQAFFLFRFDPAATSTGQPIDPPHCGVVRTYDQTSATGYTNTFQSEFEEEDAVLVTHRQSQPAQSTCRQQSQEHRDRKQNEFVSALLSSFEQEPIEDGSPHVAEQLIGEALRRYKTLGSAWVQTAYLRNIKRPVFAASILRCIGRLSRNLTAPWDIAIVVSGLWHPDAPVREAAVRVLEVWGGRDALEILEVAGEKEVVPWLKNYMRQLLTELSE
jgi:hypothetical protein